jgi:hypothetical protein
MLVERNRLLLAVKNFPLPLLLSNPYWSLRRFIWHAYAASRRKGASGQFVSSQGWIRLLPILLRSYIGAARLLPSALRERRKIRKIKKLSNDEIHELLRRFQIDLPQLTLRD